jgi:hypothetical protein
VGATVVEGASGPTGPEPTDPALDPGPEVPAEERTDHVAVAHLRGRWLTVVAVGMGLALAAGLVLRFWTRSALWLDEALTVNIARLPLSHLHAALRRDGAPPLYYVLLHFWMQIFGTSDGAVRALSGVLSVLTLPMVWVAGRRFGGRTVAWVATLLVATAPFAVYYATESRMYALVMFLTAGLVVALEGVLRRPGPLNLLGLGLCTAALLYSQYWSLYLVATVGIWLLWRVWRHPGESRHRALLGLAALAVGALAFVPWLPTFAFQSAHTGTPWAKPPNFAAIINAVTGFTDNQATTSAAGSNQGRLLALFYFVLGFLGLFGLAKDRFHIDLDIRTRPEARSMAWVVVGTLAIAVTGGILTGSAFSVRYASVVFVPLILLVSLGSLALIDVRIHTVVLAVAAAAGLAGAAQNVVTKRTEAPAVAAALAAHARPGDVIGICPDQLGPEVARLLPTGRYPETTFPRGTGPRFVNWVDYTSAVDRAHPAQFAAQLEHRAGHDHAVWLVYQGGYQGFSTKCEQIAADISQAYTAGGGGAHQWVWSRPSQYYDPMNLVQFNPPGLAPR